MDDNKIVGNCSECGGPVIEQFDNKMGVKYYLCLACSLKKYIDYGKTIDMSKKKKITDDQEFKPADIPSWPQPTLPIYPYNPISPPYWISPITTKPYPFKDEHRQYEIWCTSKI